MPTNDQSAGATPAAGGAMPPQSPPAPPAPAAPPVAPDPPATGDPDALREPGKRALDAMKAERDADRAARKVLEQEIADLKTAGQSESEKAIAAAKKEGANEVRTKVHDQIRRSEVKAALTAAGVNGALLDLAIRASVFEGLKVDDDGDVTGLADAIEAFRKSHPEIFTKPPVPGSADGGTRGPTGGLTFEQVKKMTPEEVNARWDEVSKVLAASGQR